MNRDDELMKLGERLRAVATRPPLFLDTETSGLGPEGRVVEITILSPEGQVRFNSLVNPEVPIPATASAVHGITNDVVRDAPPWPEIDTQVGALLAGHMVVTYNADFDRRMIAQTRRAYGLAPRTAAWYCLMQAYALYHGDLHPIHRTYSYQKLAVAMEQMHLPWPDLPAHRAAADVEAARRLFWHLVERFNGNGHQE